jgi:hypothetical protein
LAVGNNGESLVADSSTSTGLRYTGNYAAGKNGVLNSNFSIWQRGTTFNPNTSGYCADRWACTRGVTGATITRQLTSDTTNLPNIQYCARVQRDSTNTATNAIYLTQSFENVNSTPFIGQTVTYSFYARKGANFSGSLEVYLASGTGTDQNVQGTWTSNTYVINQTVTLTTSWARYSYTGTIASSKTQIAPMFVHSPTGTAGAADYFEVTGVQLEIGSVATAYSPNSGTFQGELAACQRYYYRSVAGPLYAILSGPGLGTSGTTTSTGTILPVPMRVAPTAVEFSNLAITLGGSYYAISAGTISTDTSTTNTGWVNWTNGSGTVGGTFYVLRGNASASSYVGFTAEL